MGRSKGPVFGPDARCSVCRATSIRAEPFYYFWGQRRWWIARCIRCTHGFVYPPLTRTEQEAIYDDRYFTESGDWVEGVWRLGYVDAEPRIREESAEVLSLLPESRGRLLEIGCAGGFFLDEARKRGFDVTGIELNDTMVAHARTVLGLEVVQGRIEDIPRDRFEHRFDVVVLMDVLEHIPDPYALFDKVSEWLAGDARILVRGPLHNDPIAKAKEWVRRVLWIEKELPGYPLDVNAFTKESLTRLLHEFGFGDLVWIGTTRDFSNLIARRIDTVAPERIPVR